MCNLLVYIVVLVCVVYLCTHGLFPECCTCLISSPIWPSGEKSLISCSSSAAFGYCPEMFRYGSLEIVVRKQGQRRRKNKKKWTKQNMKHSITMKNQRRPQFVFCSDISRFNTHNNFNSCPRCFPCVPDSLFLLYCVSLDFTKITQSFRMCARQNACKTELPPTSTLQL